MTNNIDKKIDELADWILHTPAYTKHGMIVKIQSLIASERSKADREARIDELNKMDDAFNLDDPSFKYSHPNEDGWDYDIDKYFADRLSELQANQLPSEEVEDEK